MRFYDDEDIDDDEKEKEAEARQQMEEEEEEYNESRRTERVEVEEPDEDAEEEEQQGGNGRRRHKKKKEDNEDDNDKSDSNSKNESGNSGKDKEQSGKADSKAESKSKSKKESDYEDQTKSGKKEQSSADSTGRQPKNKPQNKPNDKTNNKPKPDKNKAGKSGDAAKKGAKQGTKSAQTASNASNASKAANASKTAANASKAAKSTGLIAKIGTVGLVVLIVFLVLGLLFFFITMPGLVVGKINQKLDEWLIGIANFFNGSGAAERSVNLEQMVNAAKYVENMGYDLQGYGFLDYTEDDDEIGTVVSAEEQDGFLTRLKEILTGDIDSNPDGPAAIDPQKLALANFKEENAEKRIKKAEETGEEPEKIKDVYLSKNIDDVDLSDTTELKKSILMVKNSDGEVEFVKSKYLYMYLVAANSTYLVRNDNVDFAGRVFKVVGAGTEFARENGVGLIYFTDANGEIVQDYVSGIPSDAKFASPEVGPFGSSWFAFKNRYNVDKEKKTLTVENSHDGIFKNTSFTYNLAGWISQYGMPLQLSLALHLSSMAPDFAYEVASNAAANTKAEIGLVEIKGVDIKLILHLDLGDGAKDYFVDREFANHRLSTGDGDDDLEENDYNSQTEASADNELDIDESPTDRSESTFEEELELLENEISNKYNAEGRIPIGSLVYKTNDLGSGYTYSYDNFKITSTTMYDTDRYPSKVEKYSYSVTSSYVQALKNLLEKYGKTTDPLAKRKVRNIITTYFKLESIDSVLRYDGGYDVTISTDNDYSTVKQYIEEILPSAGEEYDFHYNGAPDNYYYFHPGGRELDSQMWYMEKGTNPAGTIGSETGFFYNGSLFFVPPISDFYELVIEGDTANIGDLESFGEYLIDNLFVPYRYYYRLVECVGDYGDLDGDGEIDNAAVRTDLTAGKGIDDYIYTTSARKYYKNDDGWFWGKSIPIGLYNAIEKAKFDKERGLREAEAQAELDGLEDIEEIDGESDEERTAREEAREAERTRLEELLDDIRHEEYEPRSSSDFGGREENDVATGILQILQKGFKTNTDDLTKYLPILLKVKEHWYEDLRYDHNAAGTKSPCYKWDTSESGTPERYEYVADGSDSSAVADAADADIMYIEERAPGKIVQIAKPEARWTGDFLNSLLNKEYYIYDGRGRSEEKRKIDLQNMTTDAIAMLEQIQGEDAQQIIRMFKLYMESKGIHFETTKATGYKKTLCSSILSKDDWNCEDNLLVEDNSSYVLRADIPPTQYGFPISTGDKPIYVLAPTKGRISYRSDDSVCIEINDNGGEHEKWTLLISGFKVNSTLKENDNVTKDMKIGQTVQRDIKMVLRDENGAIIENTYDTVIDAAYDQHKGDVTKEVNGRRTASDIYYVVQQSGVFSGDEKARIGNAGGEFIQALVDMQDTYNIDPLWALAVAHWESRCGTCYSGENRLFNIAYWSGIRGYAGESGGFATYSSDYEAIMDFGNYAKNRMSRPLTNVDDFEEFNDGGGPLKLFENAKKKDYPTYLKLKTILSSKGV